MNKNVQIETVELTNEEWEALTKLSFGAEKYKYYLIKLTSVNKRYVVTKELQPDLYATSAIHLLLNKSLVEAAYTGESDEMVLFATSQGKTLLLEEPTRLIRTLAELDLWNQVVEIMIQFTKREHFPELLTCNNPRLREIVEKRMEQLEEEDYGRKTI